MEYLMKKECRRSFARVLCALCALALLLLCFPAISARAEVSKFKRTVRVGYYIAPGFQEYNASTEVYSGSGYEYLIALRQYANWDYEFVPVSFSEGVQMLMDGKLDLMNNVSRTPERENLLGFSEAASGSNCGCLIVSADDTHYADNDYAAFASMRVGMLEKSLFRPYFADFCAAHNIQPTQFFYPDDDAMTAALNRGEIDARVVSSSYRDGSRIVARFAPMSYYFAVPKNEIDLLNELNEAMSKIQTDMPGFEQALQARYETRTVEKNIVLSDEEKAFVAAHRTVTVAVGGNWYPLYYAADGGMAGPLAEIYQCIADVTGLSFEPVHYDSYLDAYRAVRAGETDMVLEFPYDFVYADRWNVQLSDKVGDIEFYCLLNESCRADSIRTVAFYGEPYLESQVRKKYSGITVITCSSLENAVDAVLHGDADCTFVSYYASAAFRSQGKYISLKYVLIPSLRCTFGLGICDEIDPCLKSLIGKGLRTLDTDTLESLFQSASPANASPDLQAQFYQNPTIFLILFAGLGAFVVLVAFFVFYSRRMKKKNAELESARHAQTVFLSRMSHDMRTPMNGIMGLASLSADETNATVLRDNVHKIQESGNYLLSLINDTLDFQRIESGKMTLDPRVVPTETVLDGILDIIRPAMESKHLHFTVQNDNADLAWYIRLDPVRFKQIFINLLSNAIKFTPEGGHITFAFGCLGREGMISHDYLRVSDDGIGMSADFVQNRLFQPFSQESNAVSTQYAGSGLGLSIVKSLVALMGGRIEVESSPGVGTTFTVYLDFERVKREEAQELLSKNSRQLSDAAERLVGRHILLVEDHPLNAEIAQRLLSKVGCTVEWVSNGQLGLEAVRNAPPNCFDAVLMDIRMPVMGGLEAARAIRALDRPDAKTLPIIAMTANAYAEDIQQSLDAGMNAHLAKPIDPQRMYATLVQYLSSDRPQKSPSCEISEKKPN